MTGRLRILNTGLRDARWNVAMTVALAQLHSDGAIDDTVRFHRYARCVLIGNGQQLSTAADVEYCRRNHIDIARRATGGGAVYMSPRMLAWDVVLQRPAGAVLYDITDSVCSAVAAGLSTLGVDARFEPPNAVVVNGAKISGSSGYFEGRSAVLQGTVLIEDDAAEMASSLGIAPEILRPRISCLAAALGTAPSLSDVQGRIAAALAEHLERAPSIAEADSAELTLTERLLREEIGADEYVTGREALVVEGAQS